METKRSIQPVLLLIVILLAAWFAGCATTGETVQGERSSGEVADIDELLGLTDEGTSQGESESIAEDDVLRLLGVVDEADPPPTTQTADASIQDQRQALVDETQALDEQEQNLRDEIAGQEQQLAAMDSGTGGEAVPTRESATPSWKSASFQDRYQEARQDYLARRYRQAAEKFQNLLSTNTRHSLSDNCQYWIGESYYGLGNYRQAIVAFEKVFSFPDSNKDADAQLKLGICYMRLDEREQARQEFQKLVDNYPTSEYVSVARRYIEQM